MDELPLLIVFLSGIAMISFAVYLSFWSEGQTQQARDWCTEQGGYMITERGAFQACIDASVIIPPPPVGE